MKAKMKFFRTLIMKCPKFGLILFLQNTKWTSEKFPEGKNPLQESENVKKYQNIAEKSLVNFQTSNNLKKNFGYKNVIMTNSW